MNVVVKLPELDLSVPHKLKVVHAEVKNSKSGNEMTYLLLREEVKGVSVSAFIMHNMFDKMRNFANAFNIPIVDGVIKYTTEELIGREVYAKIGTLSDGSYVVNNFVVNSQLIDNKSHVQVADLNSDDDEKEDPFVELSEKLSK